MATAENAPLWMVPLQKEAFDLMVSLWRELDDAGRNLLVTVIVAGPPLAKADPTDAEEAERLSRFHDRAIFERLALLERQTPPSLPPAAEMELARLRNAYPQWKVEDGDRPHFTFWLESGVALETEYTVDELLDLHGRALLQKLTTQVDRRQAMLEVWQAAAAKMPFRALMVIKGLAAEPNGGLPDVWRATLWGLRDAWARPVVARRLIASLARAPDTIFQSQDFVFATSDALNDASKRQEAAPPYTAYWQLWDRLYGTIVEEGGEKEPPQNNDWVFLALNQPIGKLAEALVNELFKRGLKVGQGIPEDLKPRFDNIVREEIALSRLARVILVSRLSYLFAVDREWTVAKLVPFLNWDRSEDEAAALWRAFAWQPRINAELWTEIARYFLDGFAAARLAKLGDAVAQLARVLMVVGVELPHIQVPADRARSAIRAMEPEARMAAVWWLADYVRGKDRDDQQAPDDDKSTRADLLWRERVLPWIRRVWPRDHNLVEQSTTEAFARLAIATDQTFDEAITELLPFMAMAERWGFTVDELAESRHPDEHPLSSLQMLGKVVRIDQVQFMDTLRRVLGRIGDADPNLQTDKVYRRLDIALHAAGR